MMKLAILISGNGSNMAAIYKSIASKQLKAVITSVTSNNPQAAGLEQAKAWGLTTHVLDHQPLKTRDAFDAALALILKAEAPDFIVLAGFMRILGPQFVSTFQDKILNIHPSLLPKHKGLHTHQKVLDKKDLYHGTSVHLVNHELDGGALIAQKALKIENDDTAESLDKKIKVLEHQLYPWVLQELAEGRIKIKDGVVFHLGEELSAGGLFFPEFL